MDCQGLAPAQVRGFGLGVMNARAPVLRPAGRPLRLISSPEGRAFGPHGEDLVLANSVAHYDDALSRELTDQVAHANLEMRRPGLQALRGPRPQLRRAEPAGAAAGDSGTAPPCMTGQVFMGCRNRLTPAGIEIGGADAAGGAANASGAETRRKPLNAIAL